MPPVLDVVQAVVSRAEHRINKVSIRVPLKWGYGHQLIYGYTPYTVSNWHPKYGLWLHISVMAIYHIPYDPLSIRCSALVLVRVEGRGRGRALPFDIWGVGNVTLLSGKFRNFVVAVAGVFVLSCLSRASCGKFRDFVAAIAGLYVHRVLRRVTRLWGNFCCLAMGLETKMGGILDDNTGQWRYAQGCVVLSITKSRLTDLILHGHAGFSCCR